MSSKKKESDLGERLLKAVPSTQQSFFITSDRAEGDGGDEEEEPQPRFRFTEQTVQYPELSRDEIIKVLAFLRTREIDTIVRKVKGDDGTVRTERFSLHPPCTGGESGEAPTVDQVHHHILTFVQNLGPDLTEKIEKQNAAEKSVAKGPQRRRM
uniref:Uncharacterized protein n=1 Tax=Chromera velia CCMP2878 TaxID=1169474 RepID=A0A0G4G806_9ALVE|eukprot:Cvel_4309.t1-p1 / transcript=Cvel_4309.t1 / gene=Cvel_4309 / organism=Chromera_velia_CCMP2878 / gene_product=hypothetical protein / transcript_product=hypothetical protein / location=Cvel_scaffold187:8425-12197(+) / protein_length=153 / sequence_SO=supercontig / SO=protein_coding / is_pseudo=false